MSNKKRFLDEWENLCWSDTDPEDLWMFDKLLLSKRLGYKCGPVGTAVPEPGKYIVRPCINPMGLGLGAEIQNIMRRTDHLPPGHFWCEIFDGDHVSVDYEYGKPTLTVKGIRSDNNNLTRWKKWIKTENNIKFPDILKEYKDKYKYFNCEFIDNKLIEVHLRVNPDFAHDNSEYVPVFKGDSIDPPAGYRYIKDPEAHGRIGAFIK
tara:strand:+ start:385 stop:1005 length:621 start_codon:yes stop_codon:yes gene_type:complete